MMCLRLVGRVAGIVLASFVFASINANAANEDEALWAALQKAAAAARGLSYKGTFVCQNGQQTKSVQLTHFFDGKNEFARNVLLDGAPKEVLSQGSEVVIYNPKNEKVVIEKRRGQNMFPAMLPANLALVKENYSLRAGGIERVAARQAQVLFLEPRDGLRYQYKFYLDIDYGLLLKSVMFNQRGEIMESIGFNQLTLFNAVELDWFKPKVDHSKSYVMEEEQVMPAESVVAAEWALKELPAGYHKVDQMVRKVQGKPYPVTHVVFSDGLASVSLFIEFVPTSAAIARTMLATTGSTSFYASMNSGHLITAVGEVPQATVVQIANAVVFKK